MPLSLLRVPSQLSTRKDTSILFWIFGFHDEKAQIYPYIPVCIEDNIIT